MTPRTATRVPDRLADAPLSPAPGARFTPSPHDWRDEIFYSVLLDRFSRGGISLPLGDPRDGRSRHGGNLRGVIDRLPYLRDLGASVLVLSPVTRGVPEAYHGYAPVHLLDVDPHLGTPEDYRELVRSAHAHGLRVVQDLVLNHAGPVFRYVGGSSWDGADAPPKPIEWVEALKPEELSRDAHFTRRGVITDWSDPRQAVTGDFPPDYRHFATDRPETQELLARVAKWWMKEYDLDGFRIDAVRHVAPTFVGRLSRELRTYALALGKSDFMLLGENSTGIDHDLLLYLGPLGSLYDYPSFRRENRALHGAAPARELEDSARAASDALGGDAARMLRFLDNHDTYRFLRVGEPVAVLKTALVHLLFSTGVPMIYYGTEQGFRQGVSTLEAEGPDMPADPGNREDMFEGGEFKSPSSSGDRFDGHSPLYRWVRRLAALRRAHPALRRGRQYPRWADPAGPGLCVFSRIHEGEEALVAVNTSADVRCARVRVDAHLSPAGTQFVDALDPRIRFTAKADPDGGSVLEATLPPRGARLLVHVSRHLLEEIPS